MISELRLKRKRGMGPNNRQSCKDEAQWGEGLQMKGRIAVVKGQCRQGAGMPSRLRELEYL